MAAGWDARYRESPGPAEPAGLLTGFSHILPARGRALDIACGSGRNSIWLAQRGLEVEAVDISSEALRLGRDLAVRSKCSVKWHHENVERFQFETGTYELIICFNYRGPALYSRIMRALRPGGWVVYETYTLEQLRLGAGPQNPEHLLRPGELLSALSNLRVAFYREVTDPRAVASIVAQRMPSADG